MLLNVNIYSTNKWNVLIYVGFQWYIILLKVMSHRIVATLNKTVSFQPFAELTVLRELFQLCYERCQCKFRSQIPDCVNECGI